MESPLGPVRGRHVEPGASAGLHPDPKWSARQRLTRTASAGEWKLPSSSSRVTLAARAAPQVTAHALVDLVASAPCLSPVITALKHHGGLERKARASSLEARALGRREHSGGSGDRPMLRSSSSSSLAWRGSRKIGSSDSNLALASPWMEFDYPWASAFGAGGSSSAFGRSGPLAWPDDAPTRSPRVASPMSPPRTAMSTARGGLGSRAASPTRRSSLSRVGTPGNRRLGTSPPSRRPAERLLVSDPRLGIGVEGRRPQTFQSQLPPPSRRREREAGLARQMLGERLERVGLADYYSYY